MFSNINNRSDYEHQTRALCDLNKSRQTKAMLYSCLDTNNSTDIVEPQITERPPILATMSLCCFTNYSVSLLQPPCPRGKIYGGAQSWIYPHLLTASNPEQRPTPSSPPQTHLTSSTPLQSPFCPPLPETSYGAAWCAFPPLPLAINPTCSTWVRFGRWVLTPLMSLFWARIPSRTQHCM